MSDQTQFHDGESGGYNKDMGISFKDILMRQIEAINVISRQEFCGGYYDYKDVLLGGGQITQQTRVYVQDTRQQYVNAVNQLSDLLLPKFDEDMKRSEEDIQKEIDELVTTEEKEEKIPTNSIISQRELKITRKLFRALSLFLNRIDYLETEAYEE